MKKLLCQTILLAVFSFNGYTQSDSLKIDSLKKILATEKEDTNRVNTLDELAILLVHFNTDTAMIFFKNALMLAIKLNYEMGIADMKTNIGKLYASQSKYNEGISSANDALILYNKFLSSAIASNKEKILNKLASCYNVLELNIFPQGNYPEALKIALLELKIREEIGDKEGICTAEFNIGNIYYCQRNYPEALKHHFVCLKICKQLGSKAGISSTYSAIGLVYFDQGNYEEASKNYSDALKLGEEAKDTLNLAEIYVNMGLLNDKQQNYTEALKYDFAALKIYNKNELVFNVPFVLNNIAVVYMKEKRYKDASEFFSKALSEAKRTNHLEYIKLSYENMAILDSLQGNYKQALEDYKLSIIYRDNLMNADNTKKIIQQQMQYDFDKKEAVAKAEQDKKDTETKRIKNQQFFTIVALGIVVLAVVIITIIQFRSNKHKQQANIALQQQKQKVENTLSELKSTQSQLIQSEKMASLGELTAGIAHEIQNPLNFVNNFSEVSNELIDEMKEELSKGNYDDVNTIADDVKQNLEKINHHGKRADAIVKGMLQHSRSSTGVKEATDINALADEYLRLSYHGLRAKDNSFNVTMKTDFDESISKINIIPQDIGRVLLNLYNNAFYAVAERRKMEGVGYEPTISVTTKKSENQVSISVSDNGNGMPQKIIDKIFQPFFTTKPTGQGTGLGLSLSYDIIKAHSGEIKVETKEGEGSEFIIQLPAV